MKFKKAILAATVLTALAATAFAAAPQDTNNQPSMRDKVNKILHENDQKPAQHKNDMRGFPPRPKLTEAEREQVKNMTPEQRKAFFKEKKEAWINSMTPEQKAKYEQHKKQMQERKAAHDKMVKEKMSKLTPEQRAEVEQFIKDDMAQRKAMGERLRKMTPEQRDAIKAQRPGRFCKPGPKHMPKGPGPVMQRGPQGDGMMPPPPMDGPHHGPQGDGMMPPPPPSEGQAPQAE